jgi:N-methyl-L-proline demethylase
VIMTLNHRLRQVRRQEGRLAATLYNEYTRATPERLVDQVVVENGTLPAAELYMALQGESSNGGQVDLDALIACRPQSLVTNPKGTYQLFRIGDAVAGRNIHAAIYDARRLCMQT